MNDLNTMLQIHCCCYEKNIYPWYQPLLYTPFWRFYWNPVPGGILQFPDRNIRMVPEYFYIIPGYLRFSTTAEKNFEQFYIHFNLSDRLKNPQHIFTIDADPDMIALIRDFTDRGNGIKNQQLTMITAAHIITGCLLKLPEQYLQLFPPAEQRIAKILQFISDNPSIYHNSDQLAKKTGMSRSNFTRLFEQQTGETPHQYISRKRIEYACKLLHYSDMSLDEIAEKTGFANRYHFSRVFKRITQISPAEFRKML